jgi:hypothetical protein
MKPSCRAIVLTLVCAALGFGLGDAMRARLAFAQPVAEGGAPRFQLSAFAGDTADGVHHGCYVIETTTGQVWHVGLGGQPEKVAEGLR